MSAALRTPLRLLLDPALPGAVNMARDEALLHGVQDRTSPATLRVYAWCEPTLSLGYFQRFAGIADQPEPIRNLAVVRRLTGGGAILHDVELTYCLALPSNHTLLAAGHLRLYELAHQVVIAMAASHGLRAGYGPDASGPCGNTQRGPFLCFHRHHALDVLVGGQKLAGSAQRRTHRGLIQHGSVILASRFPDQRCACLDPRQTRSYHQWAGIFAKAWTQRWAIPLEESQWDKQELAVADELLSKYAGHAWTRRR